MSVRSIIGGDLTLSNLNVTTINDVAYPPVSSAGTLEDVLLTGNDANGLDIIGVDNIVLNTINGVAIGTVVNGANPTISPPIYVFTVSTVYLLDTIVLPAGVWIITTSFVASFGWSPSSDVGFSLEQSLSSSTTTYYNQTHMCWFNSPNNSTAGSPTYYSNFSGCATVVLTAASTSINLTVACITSQGIGCAISNSLTVTNPQLITAVQIA